MAECPREKEEVRYIASINFIHQRTTDIPSELRHEWVVPTYDIAHDQIRTNRKKLEMESDAVNRLSYLVWE